MDKALEEIIRDIQRIPIARLAGAVKTHPLRELLRQEDRIQHVLRQKDIPPRQAQELEAVSGKIQDIITKRMEAAHQLLEKFADTTPEIIALKNSVFSLVPSRDLLEDVKVIFQNSPKYLQEIAKASANIFEAVNIEIQQKFSELSPETIAVHYPDQELQAYRRLLKNLLVYIDVDSDLFKVYNTIIRHVVEGSTIRKTRITVAKTFCDKMFQTAHPSYDLILSQYTAEQLDTFERALRASLDILERDITQRPSILEFSEHCRQLLKAIPEHVARRKIQMRKTTRVLQLSHYIEFLSAEKLAENAIKYLILCQMLFEDTRQFMINQQTHLDVTLNIRSIEDAQRKIEDGLRYRQYAVGQIFMEISGLSLKDLSSLSKKYLDNSQILLQEVQDLIKDFIQRTPSALPDPIRKFAESLGETLHILYEAMITAKDIPANTNQPPLEFESALPNLSKLYDEELQRFIQKALKTGETAMDNMTASNASGNSFVIPTEHLQKYIESFIRIIKIS